MTKNTIDAMIRSGALVVLVSLFAACASTPKAADLATVERSGDVIIYDGPSNADGLWQLRTLIETAPVPVKRVFVTSTDPVSAELRALLDSYQITPVVAEAPTDADNAIAGYAPVR